MSKARNGSSRWMNILLAVVAFCMMIVLPTVVSTAVSIVALVSAGLAHGSLTGAVANEVYALMNDHINLYSAVVYVLFGIPVFAWAWGMRHRARVRLRRARTEEQIRANQQVIGVSPSGNDLFATGAPGVSVPAAMAEPATLASAASAVPSSAAPAAAVVVPAASTALPASASAVAVPGTTPAPDSAVPAPAPAPTMAPPETARYIYYGGEPVSWQLAGQASQAHTTAQPQPDQAAPNAGEEAALPIVRFNVKGVACRYFAAGALMGYGMQIVTTLLMVLVEMLLPAVMDEYTSLVENSGITTYGIMWVVSTLVLPPLVEETGFRGLGLTYLERADVPFAVANVIQALAFGIFHMNLTQGIYTFVLGLVLGYVAHRSGSLAPAMLLHFTYNLMGTLGTSLIYGYLPVPFLFLLITNVAALICAFKLASAAPQPSSR